MPPDEITIEQYRALAGGRRPRVPAPRLAVPREPRATPDASEKTRQPYCDRGWLFAQEERGLLHFAYHTRRGARVGPAGTLRALLAMIDECERSNQ